MKYFAELNTSNIVIRVCPFDDSVENEEQASNITPILNGHRWMETYIDGSQRKNYAGPGWTYDQNRNSFIGPKTFNSWILNENTCIWEAPIPYPNDGKFYSWDESTLNWVEIVYPANV
jgi:hypothetical protein